MISGDIFMMSQDKKLHTSDNNSLNESGEWLSVAGFMGMEGMPGTAKGIRLRLEKLAAIHPGIKRKRTQGKGFEYHISAASMSLKSERATIQVSSDEQLNLWIQLFKSMTPASREKILQQALVLVAEDLSTKS